MNRIGNAVDLIFLKTETRPLSASGFSNPTEQETNIFLEFKKVFDCEVFVPGNRKCLGPPRNREARATGHWCPVPEKKGRNALPGHCAQPCTPDPPSTLR